MSVYISPRFIHFFFGSAGSRLIFIFLAAIYTVLFLWVFQLTLLIFPSLSSGTTCYWTAHLFGNQRMKTCHCFSWDLNCFFYLKNYWLIFDYFGRKLEFIVIMASKAHSCTRCLCFLTKWCIWRFHRWMLALLPHLFYDSVIYRSCSLAVQSSFLVFSPPFLAWFVTKYDDLQDISSNFHLKVVLRPTCWSWIR